ncbi:MAG: hypothetical protein WA702_23580, partial [Bradyrhizobium sp.]|uniref:hypothetical protein n=1 Tax=Bradyrhizobium sp. TaxID=376 RepID=UPI003C7B6AA9
RSVPPEGRIAIVTDVGDGMRWTRRVAAELCFADEGHAAYGEVVWSWHPGADAKPACDERAGDGAREPIPEEITYKP